MFNQAASRKRSLNLTQLLVFIHQSLSLGKARTSCFIFQNLSHIRLKGSRFLSDGRPEAGAAPFFFESVAGISGRLLSLYLMFLELGLVSTLPVAAAVASVGPPQPEFVAAAAKSCGDSLSPPKAMGLAGGT